MPSFSVLRFHTIGSWTVRDCQLLLGAVDTLYGRLLTLEILRSYLSQQSKFDPSGFSDRPRLATYLRPPVPPSEGLLLSGSEWGIRPERVRAELSSGFNLPSREEVAYFSILYEERFSIRPEARLSVDSILMSSPGSINLLGLGDLVLQIRHLIKDLRFRNSQEEELGRLAIARQRLTLQNEAALSAIALDIVTLDAIKTYEAIEELEKTGKLIIYPHPAQAANELQENFSNIVFGLRLNAGDATTLRSLITVLQREHYGRARKLIESLLASAEERGVVSESPNPAQEEKAMALLKRVVRSLEDESE